MVDPKKFMGIRLRKKSRSSDNLFGIVRGIQRGCLLRQVGGGTARTRSDPGVRTGETR
jgi:hypothetical protein